MKILAIEDEPAVANYVSMFLRDAGYQVTHAVNGRQAAEALARESFDLILLDLILPDITGPELLPQLRQTAPATPVLILTGLAQDDHRLVACLKNGAAGSVQKSARAEHLLTAVRRALRQ